ncbi:hypothetical protein TNCV_3124201 [Trichonephila clavipes]|nr:hypothetical protein TNCV_3124201 [Trichonephila clavipes]
MTAQIVKQRNDVSIAKVSIPVLFTLLSNLDIEKEITACQNKNKISYPEARRVVSSRTPVSGKAMRRYRPAKSTINSHSKREYSSDSTICRS